MSFEIPPRKTSTESLESLETQKDVSRMRAGIHKLRELAGSAELHVHKSTLVALGKVDGVLRKFPRPVQEFLVSGASEQVSGLPFPERNIPKEGGSVIEVLFGISAVSRELKKKAEK